MSKLILELGNNSPGTLQNNLGFVVIDVAKHFELSVFLVLWLQQTNLHLAAWLPVEMYSAKSFSLIQGCLRSEP